MATNNPQGDPATDVAETANQDDKAATDGTPGETPPSDPPKPVSQDGTPSDHTDSTDQQDTAKDPAKASLLADLQKERGSRKALQAQVDQLAAKAATDSQTGEQLTAVQRKYDRLEEFLSKAGGTLGKALDSKSFTTSLFETDDEISTIVTDWNKANPTATSSALGSGPAAPDGKKPSINDLLRSAAK